MSPYLHQVTRDGSPIWKLECPSCGMRGEVDDDQLYGRVSVDCPECDFHETRNWMGEQA